MLKDKKELIWASLFIIIMLGTGLVTPLILLKNKTNIPTRAQEYQVTGSWKLYSHVQSPQKEDGESILILNQDSSGNFSGTMTNTQGNTTSITGYVNGNQFRINEIRETGNYGGFDYETIYSYDGNFVNKDRIEGTISGQVIKPITSDLRGTFEAIRINSTSIPSPINPPQTPSQPTPPLHPTPIPTNSPPTSYSSPRPTSTPIPLSTPKPSPPPQPESGYSIPTLINIITGGLIILISIILPK